MTNLSEAAIKWCEDGYAVIPIRVDSKTPHIKWKEYQDRKPTKEEVTQWWSQWPDAFIAVIGGHDGLVCLDIDNIELADNLVPEFERIARLERSPKGGLHIFLKEDETSKSGVLVAGVADIKGAKAYFIVAPSKGYEHVNEVERTWSVPMGTARDMAVQVLRAQGYEAKDERAPITFEDGSRNMDMTRLAGAMYVDGMTEEKLLAGLRGVNNTLKSPLTDEELVNTAKQSQFWSKNALQGTFTPKSELPTYREEVLEVTLTEYSAAEIQSRAEDDDGVIPYLPTLGVNGFFVKGWTHLLAAYPKTGKTELLTTLCNQWCALGETILYFSEEPEAIWRSRLSKYPKWDGMQVVLAMGVEPERILERITTGNESIVIVDTTRNLLQFDDENNNSEVARRIIPIIKASKEKKVDGAEKSLVLIQHTRKSGGEHGRAIAGAHAFLGVVDIAIELDRDPNAPNTNRRLLHGQGRIEVVPDLIYELNEEDKLVALGDPGRVEFDSVRDTVRNLITEEWQGTKDILNQMEYKPSQEHLRNVLVNLASTGQIERDPPISESARGRTHTWRSVTFGAKQQNNALLPPKVNLQSPPPMVGGSLSSQKASYNSICADEVSITDSLGV